ncbi:MAG TPA: hypothetical protein VL137_18645, partial [Polyangiaceae bacterium]|nr:hypothetical protein [Polyangiaceae bacterium]
MKRVQSATSRMRGALACGLIISGFLTMSCGGGGLGTPVSQFPSRDALDSAADDSATPSPSGKMIELDQWQMAAPAAELDAVNQSLTDGLRQRLSASDKAKFSPELACAAREAARIYAEHDALPDFGLQDYLVMRCGGSALSVQMAVAYIETRPDQSDAQVQSGMQKFTDDMIDAGLQGPHITMGIGFARGAARAATVIAHSSLAAEIKYAPVLATGSEVKISGTSFSLADSILGVITSGQYGVALCQPDRSVKLP